VYILLAISVGLAAVRERVAYIIGQESGGP
jgi:hypothetical protein